MTVIVHSRISLFIHCSALALLALLFVPGCSDEPTATNSIGGSLVNTSVLVHDTTITAIADSVVRQNLPMDGATNLVGRYGNYVAYTAMQFGVPSRDSISILSATIRLHATSWFGDSTSAVRFTLYRINQSWTQPQLTWDSVQQLSPFYGTNPLGTYDGAIESDTQDIVITLTDTAEVRTWFSSTNDPPRYGFMLVPDPTVSVVRGFASFSYSTDTSSAYPTLTIDAVGPSGFRDTTDYQFGADTFVGNAENFTPDPKLIYVQGGLVYRSTLRFDSGFLPRGAIINSAELMLTLDPESTILSKVTADTVVAVHAVVSATDPLGIEATSTPGSRQAGSEATFGFDLRRPVQLWANGYNYGILLHVNAAAEFSSFDRYAFFNHTAADSLRPRVRILYTIPK